MKNMLLRAEAVRKKRSAHTYRSIIHDLHWSKVRPPRAGVVPYIQTEKGLCFAFGLDTEFRELTDFGGGVSYKKDKTAVVGALREFREESLSVFEDLTVKDVSGCFVLYNTELMILFLRVYVNPKERNAAFHEKLKDEKTPEVCDIVWLGEQELSQSLDPKSRLLYVRVRDLLVGAGDFYPFLRKQL